MVKANSSSIYLHSDLSASYSSTKTFISAWSTWKSGLPGQS